MPRIAAALILIAHACICLPAQGGKPFDCGPFLLQPTPTSIVIVVDHTTPTKARITLSYNARPGRSISHSEPSRRHTGRSFSHSEPSRHHVFKIDKLPPNTVCRYRVRGNGLDSGEHSFRTLPVEPDRYRFLVLGDVRSDPTSWAKVSNLALSRDSDALFMVGTGDYPNDGRKYNQWIGQFFQPARGLLAHFPFWPAIGNHESTRTSNGLTINTDSHYFSLFELPGNERWYRMDYQFLTLLVIDSNSRMGPGSEQYDWLLKQLRSLRNRYTVLSFHHAPFSSGPHGKRLADGTPKEWPIDEGRRFLAPLFELYGVDLVLNGHDHMYEHSVKSNVDYIVTGGGGAPLYQVGQTLNRYAVKSRSVHHYLTVDVSPKELLVTAVDKQGNVFDTIQITADPDALARRQAKIETTLRGCIHLGKVDETTGHLPISITNPFAHPLTGSFQSSSKEHPFELNPNKAMAITIDVSSSLPDTKGAALSPHIMLQLPCTLATREHELTLQHKFNAVTLLRRGTLVATGSPLTSKSPAFIIDHESPVVHGVEDFTGKGDIHAAIRLGWTNKELIVRVDLTDAAISFEGAASPLERDAVLLMLAAETPGSPMMQVLLGVDSIKSGPLAATTKAVVKRTAKGWTLEARIPATSLGFPMGLTKQSALLMDVLLVDRDSHADDMSYHRALGATKSLIDVNQLGRLILYED